MELAARQLLRALRGKRSQVAFSRRLGYRGNPIADWEAGRRTPTAQEMLRAFLPAIRGVRSRLCPPNTALTEELSTTTREKSILLAPRSRPRSTSWIFCHTPCSCHRRRYRQQLIPAPHPNSCGSISQGIPLRSTYRIPIRARRRSMGFRPGFRNLRGFGGGSNGSFSFHKSSGMRSSTFTVPSQLRTIGSISYSRVDIKSLC